MKLRYLLAALLLGGTAPAWAQTGMPPTPDAPAPANATTLLPPSAKHRGTLYFSWGYNRDWYSRSDIHFINTTTDNYDFTLVNAHASDHPSMSDFWKFNSLTVPQYDATLGYMFNDQHDLGIEVSWNHLKYVVDDNQVIHVRGNLRGHYIDKDTLVTPDFVHLQHTNGNNYLMVNLVKRRKLLVGRHLQLSAIGKVGLGPMITYTISTIYGAYQKDPFHYQGMVFGGSAGLRFDIYKHFFLQGDLQGAVADYTFTRIGPDKVGRVTHIFSSAQAIYAFGFNFPL
ncbi:hypothetical protein ACFQ48_07195 [Hymenobacter caeli]|uniref:Outer membrane protein beta-barrel domain-containing protein n=1 Tax=Hymenobacter caeli TaxID=2735894 RepID=A0ABX2FLM4_9BACT|nr:hypothetical protein [Hymenobacter caeli]NRT18027.1 hypothetical protein [Hymenobacter caeli]